MDRSLKKFDDIVRAFSSLRVAWPRNKELLPKRKRLFAKLSGGGGLRSKNRAKRSRNRANVARARRSKKTNGRETAQGAAQRGARQDKRVMQCRRLPALQLVPRFRLHVPALWRRSAPCVRSPRRQNGKHAEPRTQRPGPPSPRQPPRVAPHAVGSATVTITPRATTPGLDA